MSAILVFENTSFKESGKSGVLKPDASGHYEVVLGAFGSHNSSGAYYPDDKVKKLFTNSSELMNRTQNGRLYGEWGHPKMDPGMTTRDYLVKLLIMHEEQFSHHIKKLELHENFTNANNTPCLGVIGWIKPFGPHGHLLEESFNTPEQNCCFSLRSISLDSRDSSGRLIKNPVKIVTYDAVGEPGLDVADKYHNPAVESRTFSDNFNTRHEFTETDVLSAMENAHKTHIGLESAVPALESMARLIGITNLDEPVGRRNVKADARNLNKWMSWGK